MSLPVMSGIQPMQAKFQHEGGVSFRLQVFVLPQNEKGEIATLQLEGYDGWTLSGEALLINESPDQCAERVVKSWYASPLKPKLERILNFPATGPEDNRWYMVLVYTAKAPAKLEATPDTLDLKFRALNAPPEKWAMAHGDVWGALQS